MRTYDCFGSYDPSSSNKAAVIDISIRRSDLGNYEFKYYNITNDGQNGLVICFKSTDSNYNGELNNKDLDFHTINVDLDNNIDIEELEDAFDFSKPIYVITYHDDNVNAYEDFAKDWISWLKNYNIAKDWEDNLPPPFVPARSGFGSLKRM